MSLHEAVETSKISRMSQISPPKIDDPVIEPSDTPKLWRAGTLTYTAGGLAILFFWLLWGDFASAMSGRSVGPMMQLLLRKHEASNFLISLLLTSVTAFIAMFLAPIISYKSDRHRGKWGRRIPFLLIPTPIAALCMALLGFCPWIGMQLDRLLGAYSPGLNQSTLIAFGVCWILFDFANIIATAVFGSLVKDVVPDALLGRFFALFRIVGLLAGIVFNYWLLGKAEDYYMWIFVGCAVVWGGGITMMCLNVKEGQYPPPPPIEPGRNAIGGFLHATKGYFRASFGKSYYRWYFATTTLSVLTGSAVNGFSLLFAKSINMDVDVFGKCIAITFGISIVLSYAIGALSDRFHPLRVIIGTLVIYGLVMLWGGLFARDTWTFGIALIAHGVMNGSYATANASLAAKLLPGSSFAQMCSAGGIIGSIMGIVFGPSVGKFLDFTGNLFHRNVYHYTFYIGFGITVLALLCNFVLYRKFMTLGGTKNYVAPE